MPVGQFREFISWETETNEHHVFPARFIKGARAKRGLSQKKAEKEFGISLVEIKRVSMSAHCFYNDLFDNDSPPQVLKILHSIINGSNIPKKEKGLFIKFALCVLKEKLTILGKREEFDEIGKIIKSIGIDLNNGNKMTIKNIIAGLGLTEQNLEWFLERNFFPENWKYLREEIWSCYL